MSKIFISYSHDSQPHCDFVRGIADRLRKDGLDCMIDQHINGTPPEGWLRWMEKQIDAADFVLLMCTPDYLKRYLGEERDGGKGVTFEGVIISQHLYDSYFQSTKFIPLIPEHGSWQDVPTSLRRFGYYQMPTDYEVIYRVVTGKAKYEVPDVGEVKKATLFSRIFKRPAKIKPPVHSIPIYEQGFPVTDLNAMVGRGSMLTLLNQWWEQTSVRVVVLEAFGGTGKTALVNLWRERLWRGDDNLLPTERVFVWSFQNQASARMETSSDAFFDKALVWMGAEQTKFGSAHDKGMYLARLVKQQRTLLILDGIEVFQPYHHVEELRYQLNDNALLALLKTLAQEGNGLCLITTRKPMDERVKQHLGVQERKLNNLPISAALQLLRNSKIKGKDSELKQVAEEYKGHAYSLVLLAAYLKRYAKADIRHRDTLPPLLGQEVTEENWQGQRIMLAQARELNGSARLTLLYLVSVFDKQIEHELITELLRAIGKGYQTAFRKHQLGVLLKDSQLTEIVRDLQQQGLLLGNSTEWLDMHPLVRDFFRTEFSQQAAGFKRIVHKELYVYYRDLPEKKLPDTLDEMQPLFSAVAHGCAAGLHQQALDEAYWPRISRKNEFYSTAELGAFSDDLATMAHFFNTPWHTPAKGLTEHDKASVLGWAGFRLRALGRLREALGPMQASLDLWAKQDNWKQASGECNNLSELQLIIGDIAQAELSGQHIVNYADQSEDLFWRMGSRTTHANALHQAGETNHALALFREAEQLQQEFQPGYPLMYSLQGFNYCDLLLTKNSEDESLIEEVLKRAEQTLEWVTKGEVGLLNIPLNQLTQGRAHLQQRDFPKATHQLNQAVTGLRASGSQIYIPHGLLSRATLHRHTQNFTLAHKDLQEVHDIAKTSGMRLHLTDYHLEMARLLLAEQASEDVIRHHIQAATQLIEDTGYKRRLPELQALRLSITQ